MLLTYDHLDRVTEVKSGTRIVQRLRYLVDYAEPSQAVDALGNVTGFMYDGDRRLVEKTGPYHPDEQGRAPEGAPVVRYTHDGQGRTIRAEGNGGVVVEAHYDEAGRLVYEREAGKDPVTYAYGYLDKVLSVNRPDAGARPLTTKFLYDAAGMLVAKERGGYAGQAGTGALTVTIVGTAASIQRTREVPYSPMAHRLLR